MTAKSANVPDDNAMKRFARKLGEKVLVAYYMATDSEVPWKVRGSLLGALAYVGLPLDAIPDVVPGAGFSDDAGVLITALTAAALYVRPKHYKQARQRLRDWGIKNVDADPAGA